MTTIPATRAGGFQWQCASAFWKTFRGRDVWKEECSYSSIRSRRWVCSLAAAEPQLDSPSQSSLQCCKTIKRKVALWVGYVGTHYKGLQIQRITAVGQTIEQELETAIFRAGGILESNFGAFEKVRWMRSSRTDKGVHSLSTVISLKIEVSPETWGCNDDGIGFADRINQYLPETIKIFGIAPVNKSFDPRRGCRNRTYRYLLPAVAVGITQTNSEDEVQERLTKFRNILTSFVGCRPFHNYTVRSQYQKKSVPSTEKDSIKHDTGQKNDQLSLSGLDYSADEDESCNDSFADVLESSSPVSPTSSSLTQTLESSSNPSRILWLQEINMSDRIFSAHFRSVFSFTCGALQICKDLPYLELNVHGESFMLHQIRKMVGTAVAVMRDVLPADVVPISLACSCRVVLPLAPSEGLFLAGNEFHPFRISKQPRYCQKPENIPKLEMSARVRERKEQFWQNVLLPHMVTLLQGNQALWENWLELLERGRIGEAEMQSVRKAWSDWCVQVEERRLSQTASVDAGEKAVVVSG